MSDNRHPTPRVPKSTLLELFRTLGGVQAMWRTDPSPAAPGQTGVLEAARIWVRLTSYISVGTDEERTRYNTTTDQLDCIIVGQRQFTTSLRIESFDRSIDAMDLGERVRFRLRTHVARGIFVPARLSLRDVQAMQITEQKMGTPPRSYAVATLDVRWNWTLACDPLDPLEGLYFKQVNGAAGIPGTLTPPT